MKKVFLFFVVALAFASCGPKASEGTETTDTTAVTVDTMAVDTMAVDTASVDTTVVQ